MRRKVARSAKHFRASLCNFYANVLNSYMPPRSCSLSKCCHRKVFPRAEWRSRFCYLIFLSDPPSIHVNYTANSCQRAKDIWWQKFLQWHSFGLIGDDYSHQILPRPRLSVPSTFSLSVLCSGKFGDSNESENSNDSSSHSMCHPRFIFVSMTFNEVMYRKYGMGIVDSNICCDFF